MLVQGSAQGGLGLKQLDILQKFCYLRKGD